MKYLRSLPPNTVGGHLAKFFNNWSIEELYKKRFEKEDEESFIQGSFDDRTKYIKTFMFVARYNVSYFI